ncbi:BT1926 family outer membrane beta-barrel protein [Tenacibaculum piscium]|uniref:BT1926 family outer membrane beta-barrel protein n=1 Tax=Tenacibaculum piscium TaxID=1458515 RepID=UPI001F3BCA87|nr:BT1926 family outer membrane beta-barrel protein [Tenacibaculum piscium]MCG8182381.1 hypothetical protein [Tenacibaculum piscium]MCG8203773.1 hypothetical protein [Tenacibaculum piscium]
MKKYKKYILITLFSLSGFVANAQNETDIVVDNEITSDVENNEFRPKKGSYTVSLLMGRGSYIEQGGSYIGNANQVSGQAPYVNTINSNDNNMMNMAGVEGKYFISDKMALSLNGGFTFRTTPSDVNIPAVLDDENTVVVPAYQAIIGEDKYSLHAGLGLQWYLKLKSPKLVPYVGFSLPVDYTRTSTFDPTVNFDTTATVSNLGLSHVELFGVGVQAVAGLDYFLTKDMFIGFDVKPLSYNYVVNTKKKNSGTLGRKASNSTFSFFGQYFFKIGFKLN